MDINTLPLEKLKQFKDLFALVDRDGSGTISISELGEVLKSLGRTVDEVELRAAVATLSTETSGELDFPEFVQFMSSTSSTEDVETLIRTAFKVFDRDGKGYLLAENLKDTIETMGVSLNEKDIDEIMREADTDGNGQIDEEEFVALVKSWGAAKLYAGA